MHCRRWNVSEKLQKWFSTSFGLSLKMPFLGNQNLPQPEGTCHTTWSLKIYLPQTEVGIHGVFSWAPQGYGCVQGRRCGVYRGMCTAIDQVFLMHLRKCEMMCFQNVSVNAKQCICNCYIFVAFQKHFWNATKILHISHYRLGMVNSKWFLSKVFLFELSGNSK